MTSYFPPSASVGQFYNGYTFDGEKWNLDAEYLESSTASALYATKAELSNIEILPSQSGNSGKYLTTNGSSASWAAVSGGTSDATSDIIKSVLFFGGSN